MSTGEGIFWATFLVLFVLGVRYISKTGHWKLIGKVAGGLIALGLIIGLGFYFYNSYQNRLTQQNSLFGITLGMKPVEVRLVLGEPKSEFRNKSDGEDILNYLFETYFGSGIDKSIKFEKQNGDWRVYAICNLDPGGELYNLYTFTEEGEVIEKFGQPAEESISQDGLRKLLAFRTLNITVEIEKRRVTTVCVTDRSLKYINEYEDLTEL